MVARMSVDQLLTACCTLLTFLRDASGQQGFNEMTGFSLNPPYFNLAAGSRISASATCGEDQYGSSRWDLYCKLVGGPTAGLPTQNIKGQFCDYCTTADPTKAHPVTNAIDGSEKWWQSPPLSRGTGYNQVNVTLDLGQLFHVAYVLIKFANSPRPDLWVLERSVDNGRTFSPWQYFAHSKRECTERFGKLPNARIINDDDQLCTTEYSRIMPFENGEIVVSLVNGRPGSKNFTYSPVLQDFTQATNIRLHFLRTNTLLGHLISKAQRDPTVTRRYYYSIKDITVGGRCVCHGHAQVCVKGGDQDNPSRLQCECQHNTCGKSCDRCCPGYNQKQWRASTVDSPNECQPCQCFSHALDCYYDPEVERNRASLDTFGRYDGGGVCISCQHNTAGVNCDQCTEGFYRPYGVSPESPTGCIRYPVNQATTKSPAGPIVGPSACPVGYFNSPYCQPCICDYRGTVSAICDAYGRCLCREGVEGQRCDRCQPKYHVFPSCEASILTCNATGTEAMDPLTGFCRCRPNVEGPLCDRCKPLYWNLALDNPQGCSDCQCNLEGTLSGVGQCEQKSGQCYCKPRACGLTCHTCKDGYFLLQKKNYFGCQGCQCDIGGAIDFACDETSGQCQCRKNIVGRTCTEPAQGYYFPDLHHLKYEVEDGTTPNARPVRFGYNAQEFPDFSWRGYAVMSLSQSEVSVTVHVDPKNGRQLYRVLLRFVNPSSTSVIATVHATGSTGLHQRKEIIFPRSLSPAFLTVLGDSLAEPFALNPGKGIIHIRAEGVLLDYLVLLPKDYYDAPLLQEKVTQPCTYLPTANKNTNCLLYKHLPLEGFSSTLGSEGTLYTRTRHRRSHAHVRRPTPDHPNMAVLNERQSQLQLSLRVPRPGLYALIFEYASEMDTGQNINILNIFDTVNVESGNQILLRANIYRCAYSNLCRSVAVNSKNEVAMLDFSHGAKIILQTSPASFLLYKVYPVPAEEFSIEYVEPKVLCVSTHGHFTEDSRYCVKNQFYKPSSAWTVYASRDGELISPPTAAHQQPDNTDWREKQQSGSSSVFKPPIGGTLLKYPQTEISFFPDVPLPGSYVLVIHYSQPEHVSFPVEVRVVAGREWQGLINASFCPAVSGCRQVVVADGRIALELEIATWQRATISVSVPPRKTLVLDYIMFVPDNSYTPEMLKEKPREKSSHFTQQCSGEDFHINPSYSSQFCRDSLRSLVAAYNDGALSCDCDKSGSTGTVCNPSGGQCPCREHVIGRQCTKCATGYFGFPYCRPCECGQRLCDELTGRCICPPQTVKPACDMCQNQTFSYHPLIGCESCRCSPNGILTNVGPQCDLNTGQCSCKPRIVGRQCDRCALGHYRFPDCLPCDCDQGGVIANVCDPDTGRCLCKRNVAGVKCNTCGKGSFFLDTSSPLGCTSCFCFGASDHCQSSKKRRVKFVEMHSWHLESPENEEIPLVLNKESNTVVTDVQELPPTIHTLYWVAPPAYLGDRVTSYGGFITYQSQSFGIPSEQMTLINRKADVVLTGHSMTLIHVAPQAPLPDQPYQGRVQLVEGNWRQVGINKPVSREDLMMVLASLTGLRIRALYFTQSKRLSLGEVGLEGATTSGTGSLGNTVEHCSCPLQYAGDSCEKCAPGHYRDYSGLFFGRCLPCECNGLADECEDRTGKCLDCKYNTAGDQCERCKDGYYGNAAQRTCRVCPCPFTVPENSFAAVCTEVFGDIECICRTGYAGDRCEICTPGYYGDPLTPGGSCKPCNCGNGNNCDPKTGGCKSTLEPGDTNIDEKCKECDNCAETLLQDLEKMDDGLRKIKAQLDNASASSSSQDRLKKLEKAMSDTKNLVNKYRSAINSQKNRLDQLEEDMITFEDDVNSLENKADKKAADADKAVADVEKTHTKAKVLDSEIEKMLKNIQDLLDQLKNEGNRGDTPNESFAKLLEDAERMVNEMRNRDFTPQKTAAEKELDEAKKLLDNIKTKVTKQCDQNEATAEKIRGLLQGYEAKLKDLDKSLKDAVELVKNSNAQNNLNGQAMTDLLKRKEDIKKEHKNVEDQMALAKDELKKTEDLAEKLTNSKTEYEQLAAQLNGAKTDLTKKLNKITNAAAKKDLVEAAEDHAKNLLKQAKDLEDSVKSASGRPEVQNAKDAINAYKNITDAINAAEAAAIEAKDAADEALNNVKRQKLPERTQSLKDNSEELLKNALDAQKDLQNAANILPDLKKRLENADKKKKSLENDIQDVVNDLNNVNRENIQDMIDNAKAKAAAANDSAGTTMDRLNAIRKELDKINVSPGDSNLGTVLDDVDKSVKNLWNTIPSLSDKISEVTNLTTQFFPINNISENIKKIKELIEHARDAANRIGIPMNFVGDGHVELRPPQNLDDLKAYTTLSLLLQRPKGRGDGRRRRRQAKEEDLFVMYLGNRDTSKNYIGMALRKNILFGVYKLNGVEYEMQTGYITKSTSEPSTFDKVELQRIYQDAQMFLTKDVTSKKSGVPIQTSVMGDQSKNLLDMNPSDIVFYVGGYPDSFTPPPSLRYPKYKGCIEFSSFNDKVISLYNFQSAVNISQTPCSRYNPLVNELYFEGTGFATVFIEKTSVVLRISMSILARSENGLLLYIGSEDTYFTVSVEKGIIFIRSNVLESPATKNIKVFPTSDWKDFEFIITNRGRLFVRMASEDAASAQAEYDINDFKEFYIGGAPQDLREKWGNINIQPFKGCLKNLQLNKDSKPVDEQVGVSKGCLKESLSSRNAEFNLLSFLSADLPDFSLNSDATVSIGFKSTENQGLILHGTKLSNSINIALENGHVVFSFNGKEFKSNELYNDGEWHYLTVTKRAERIEMLIDDEDKGVEQIRNNFKPETGSSIVLGKDKFIGCLSNLYTRRPANLYRAEDLSHFKASGDILLDVCRANSLVQPMSDWSAKKDSVIHVVNGSASECVLPAVLSHVYRIGGPVSSLKYNLPQQVQQPSPHFSVEVRTRSAEGLLFFAATRGGEFHFTLYMSKGRMRLSVGKQREIFNREKYNDGKWHSVMFSLEKKKFRLVVDGIRAQDGQMSSAELASLQQFVSPVYLGNVPESLHKELKFKALPKRSVSGCVRNFKMNGAPMLNPSANLGAGPCFEGPTQRGVYFSGNGSHVIANDSFVVGSSFELLFNSRIQSPTGLLLHLGDTARSKKGIIGHYLIVYMLRGEVVARANNGKGEFMVSVKPTTTLCDGIFHKISVIKWKNVVQLYVDTIGNYKIGPPTSTNTLAKNLLYVGGIPEALMHQSLPVSSSLVGCIQDMRINGEPVAFDRASGIFGPVNLKECPG